MNASEAKNYGATEPAPAAAAKKWGRRDAVAAVLILASTAAAAAYVSGSGTAAKLDLTACPKEDGSCVEAGFCVAADGSDQNNGVIKVNSLNGDAEAAQRECLAACLAFDGATGCEVVWDQSNQGCYIHTDDVDRGTDYPRHLCWVLSKCTSPHAPVATTAAVAYNAAAPSAAAPGLRGATEMKSSFNKGFPLCDLDGASGLVITGREVTTDTNIFKWLPTSSWGAWSKDLTVDSGDRMQSASQALLKFSLDPGLAACEICDIQEAWLYLYTNSASSGTVSGYRMNVAWDRPPLGTSRGTATWSSVSADGGVQEWQHRDAASFTLVSPEDETWVKADVTTDVQAWKASQPNNGWVFKIDSSDGWDFDSSETSSGPVLVVTLSAEGNCIDDHGTSFEEYCSSTPPPTPGPRRGNPLIGGAGRPLDGHVVAETIWAPATAGRRLFDDGARAALSSPPRPDPLLDAEAWVRRGAAEHASIASFSRYSLLLAAAGAPLELLGDVADAMRDEVRHARDAYALASAIAGRAARPGPLATTSPDVLGSGAVVAVVKDTWDAGCVEETVSAARAVQDVAAAEALEHPLQGEIRAALEVVAVDEARHAALAYKVLAWAVATDPRANATLARRLPAAPADDLEKTLILPAAHAALHGARAPTFDVAPELSGLARAIEEALRRDA